MGVYHKAKVHGFSKGVFLGFWIVVAAAESCCCLLVCFATKGCWLDSLQSEMLFVGFLYGVAGLFGCCSCGMKRCITKLSLSPEVLAAVLLIH